MAFYVAGFGLLLHILFWGAGLALLVVPRISRSAWVACAGLLGVALQSAVVWIGVHTPLPGAKAYATWSLAIPVLLLIGGLWKSRGERRKQWQEIYAWRGVALMMCLVLVLLLAPFGSASQRLTTASLGSCDAADYAAGARVMLEFARDDRSGFMGLTEVVRVHSVDNFFDYWTRLNHFTPSAVLALNAAILRCEPHELVSVCTAVFAVLGLPVVYWLARATFRYRSSQCFWIVAVYGFSPLVWYAVYHVAMSQLLVAGAIAVLTFVGVVVWRRRSLGVREAWRWAPLLFAVYWLLLGAYNFIIIVCLVPAIAYAVLSAVPRREVGAFVRWLGCMLVPLLLAGGVFTQRSLGLIERFSLLQEYDFGWKIPALTPEGWLGVVSSTNLAPFSWATRWMVAAAVLVLLVVSLVFGKALRRRLLLIASCTIPILAGYTYLVWRGSHLGTNASYDAYKLLSVFYPGVLAGLASWLWLARSTNKALRSVSISFAAMVLAFNVLAATRFVKRMKAPPLMVRLELAQLQSLESRPEVTSLNMLIDDFWERLWANAFLLRKPQYFATHTYEGRKNTLLKGEWDLLGGIITVRTQSMTSASRPPLSAPYSLVRRDAPDALKLRVASGWYEPEIIAKAGTRWRWTRGDASVEVQNPHQHPLRCKMRLKARSLVPRPVAVLVNGQVAGTENIDTNLTQFEVSEVTFPPGQSTLELKSSKPPVSPGAGDERLLGIAVYEMELQLEASAGANQG
jgi:hypothetical protein